MINETFPDKGRVRFSGSRLTTHVHQGGIPEFICLLVEGRGSISTTKAQTGSVWAIESQCLQPRELQAAGRCNSSPSELRIAEHYMAAWITQGSESAFASRSQLVHSRLVHLHPRSILPVPFPGVVELARRHNTTGGGGCIGLDNDHVGADSCEIRAAKNRAHGALPTTLRDKRILLSAAALCRVEQMLHDLRNQTQSCVLPPCPTISSHTVHTCNTFYRTSAGEGPHIDSADTVDSPTCLGRAGQVSDR